MALIYNRKGVLIHPRPLNHRDQNTTNEAAEVRKACAAITQNNRSKQ